MLKKLFKPANVSQYLCGANIKMCGLEWKRNELVPWTILAESLFHYSPENL
jgi:hypothetical protein